MSEKEWKEITPNEQYRESIKRFVDGIENNHSLACIYSFARVIFEKGGACHE